MNWTSSARLFVASLRGRIRNFYRVAAARTGKFLHMRHFLWAVRETGLRLPRLIPVLIVLGEREIEAWGSFQYLNVKNARILTRMEIKPGKEAFLSFDLGGTRVDALRCRITSSKMNGDGYFVHSVIFSDPRRMEKLKSKILEILARS